VSAVSRPVGMPRVVGTVAMGLACTSLPIYLAAAFSTRIGAELGMTTASLGVAFAAFFLGGALASVPGGFIADRVGSSVALRAGFVTAAGCAGVIGGLVEAPSALFAVLFVGGFGIALMDTGGARALAAAVPRDRQGLAFGVKEASVPLAALVSGAALPLLGETFGWRPAFIGAAVISLAAGALVPARIDAPHTRLESGSAPQPAAGPVVAAGDVDPGHRQDAPLPSLATRSVAPATIRVALVALAVAAALAGGVAASAATFLVRSAESVGLGAGAAGRLLVLASAASIAVRLGSGLLADRLTGWELRFVATLLGLGTLGLVGLASQWSLALLPGAALTLGGGWGWTGLMFLAAVRIDRLRPARAAGIVLAGLAIGGTLGPVTFGALADRAGFATAWAVGAAVMATASGVTLSVERMRRTGSRA
jgi:MFS family permease